jgi:hypothetical protein
VVADDLACTVDPEHMGRTDEGPTSQRVLRCTQVHRLEGGSWRIIVRHADELSQTDEHER